MLASSVHGAVLENTTKWSVVQAFLCFFLYTAPYKKETKGRGKIVRVKVRILRSVNPLDVFTIIWLSTNRMKRVRIIFIKQKGVIKKLVVD